MRRSLFTLLFLLSAAFPAQAASLDEGLFSEVDSAIRKELKAYEVRGATAAIFDHERILWQKAFGHDDEAEKRPAALDAAYRIGGLTELWIAALALQMVEQGTLALDVPLTRYLPELRLRDGSEKKLTLSHLLAHHSGLPLDWYGDRADLKRLLAALAQERLLAPPGDRHLRSRIDYELVGHILERVSGRSLDSLLEERIFLPVGMNGSRLMTAECGDPVAGKGITVRGREIKRFEDPPCRARAAGGGVSTAYDMSRFFQMLFNEGWTGSGRVLSDRSIARIFTARYPDNPADLAFRSTFGGYADYFPFTAANFAALGSSCGFVTLVAAFPGKKIGVVLFGNTDSFILGAPKAVSRTLALLGGRLGIGVAPVPPARPLTAADIERLRPLAGRYVGNGITVDVTIEKDQPTVQWGNLSLSMIPVSPTRFRLVKELFFWVKEYYIDLKAQPDGSVVALLSVQLDDYGFPLTVFRRPPPLFYPASVKAFIGGYRPVTPGAAGTRYGAFQVRWDGPWLIAETDREKIVVAPGGDDALFTNDAVIHFFPGGARIGELKFEKWF